MDWKENASILLLIIGIASLLAYIGLSLITEDASSYWWLIPLGIVLLILCGYLLNKANS